MESRKKSGQLSVDVKETDHEDCSCATEGCIAIEMGELGDDLNPKSQSLLIAASSDQKAPCTATKKENQIWAFSRRNIRQSIVVTTGSNNEASEDAVGSAVFPSLMNNSSSKDISKAKTSLHGSEKTKIECAVESLIQFLDQQPNKTMLSTDLGKF